MRRLVGDMAACSAAFAEHAPLVERARGDRGRIQRTPCGQRVAHSRHAQSARLTSRPRRRLPKVEATYLVARHLRAHRLEPPAAGEPCPPARNASRDARPPCDRGATPTARPAHAAAAPPHCLPQRSGSSAPPRPLDRQHCPPPARAAARSTARHPRLDLPATAHAAIPSRRSRHVPPPRDAPSRRRRAHPAGEQAAVRALPDQVPAGVGDVQEGRSQLLDRGGDRPCGEPRPAATPPGHRPGHRLLGRRAAPRGGARLPSSSQPLEAPPSRVRATPSPARA